MRLVLSILKSFAVGLASAVAGWFAGYWIGIVMESKTDHSLGTGLPTVFLMYVFALAFGGFGFAAAMVWQFRWGGPRHHTR